MERNTQLDLLADDYLRGEVSFAELAAAMKRRIKAIAWQAARSYDRFKPLYDVDDYENRVLLALDKAIRNWNPDVAGFATFFERVAQYELNAVRKEMTALSRQSNLDAFSWEFHSIGLACPDDGYESREFRAAFETLPLTGQQRTICRMIMEGYRNKEIAARLGISEPAVSQALKRLRTKFCAAGLSIA